MTTYVNPSNSFQPLSEEMGRLFRYSGRQSFIADTSTTLVSDVDSVGVTDGPLGAFAKVSDSGLDFTVDTGEGVVEGALIATDEQNTVTLPDNDVVAIYLAIDPSVEGSIIVDHDQSGNVSGQPRTPLYEVETASSSVTGQTDLREIGEFLSVRNGRYETDDNSGVVVDNANDANLLGGSGPSFYAAVGQNEGITGAWTFENDISMNANNVNNVDRVTSHASNALIELAGGPSNDSPAVHTGGTGSSFVRFWDRSNSQPILQANEGGNVEIPNGSLDIHADFGHLSLHESDTGEQWNVAVSAQNLNLVNQSGGSGLLQLMPGGNVGVPNGVITTARGTAAVSGSERFIFVSSVEPSGTDGQDGDIWIQH